MSLDQETGDNDLHGVGIAQANHHQLEQQQAALQQYAQQQHHLSQNQFYEQQVQHAQQRLSQEQISHQQLLNAVVAQQHQQHYNHTAQQLAQHLPQATAAAAAAAAAAAQNSLLAAVQSFEPTAPQSEFSNRETLITYIHQYARENGFGIVISHSNEKAIYFTCELGGSYRNKRNIDDKERKRKLTTRKINCPFSMVANCKKNENDEVIKWILRITHNEHNHDKLNLTESFPMLRRRNPEINRQIRELYLKGNKPLVIERILKEKFSDILINREDIYNETRKMKREEKLKNQGVPFQTSQPQHQQSQSHQQDTHQQQTHGQEHLKDFDQTIPNLLQANGIPLNLASQYVSQLAAQQDQLTQQQLNTLAQAQYTLQQAGLASQNVVNEAIENANQNPPKNADSNLSNIDISLVKQQGL